MDGPHAARSGHQGTAMSLAPLAHVLFTRVMKYDASRSDWADRDRFVLSVGHASILQYAMLHLAGFGLTLDDLQDFRQWGSATPGHPEVGHTAGVEVTTGPLGQKHASQRHRGVTLDVAGDLIDLLDGDPGEQRHRPGLAVTTDLTDRNELHGTLGDLLIDDRAE